MNLLSTCSLFYNAKQKYLLANLSAPSYKPIFLSTFLSGFLPAPLYMGAAIQSTCMLERIECGISGDCLIYNAEKFRFTYLVILFGLNVSIYQHCSKYKGRVISFL